MSDSLSTAAQEPQADKTSQMIVQANPSLDPENASSLSQEFHLFLNLTEELQLIVWKFAAIQTAENRVVVLRPQRVPAVMHACQNSRLEALKIFTGKLSLEGYSLPEIKRTSLYNLSPQFDVVLFTEKNSDVSSGDCDYLDQLIHSKMQHLALIGDDLEFVVIFDEQVGDVSRTIVDKLFNSEHLKSVTIFWDYQGFPSLWGHVVKDSESVLALRVFSDDEDEVEGGEEADSDGYWEDSFYPSQTEQEQRKVHRQWLKSSSKGGYRRAKKIRKWSWEGKPRAGAITLIDA